MGVESTEQVATPENIKPVSTHVIARVAAGNFDVDKPIDSLPTEVSRTSYDALNNHSMQKRQEDETRFSDQLKQNGTVNPEVIRHNHMTMWAMRSTAEIKDLVDIGQTLKEKNQCTTDIATALDKLHISLDPTDVATTFDNFYDSLNSKESQFYKQFCGTDMPEMLAETLKVEEMMLLKPFLTNFMLGSEEAFDALITLRKAKDMVDKAKSNHSYETNVKSKLLTTLTREDINHLAFWKTAANKLNENKTQQKANTRAAGRSQQQSKESAINEEKIAKNAYAATIANPNHTEVDGKKINDDTYFIDATKLQGGIFDGIEEYSGSNEASKAASQAIKNVLQTLQENPTEKIVTEKITEAFQAANSSVKETGGKTTATVFQVVTMPEGTRKLIVGTIGDSRIYVRKKDGTIIQVTQDQNILLWTLQQMLTKTELNKQDELQEGFTNRTEVFNNLAHVSNFQILPDPEKHYWNNRNKTNFLGLDESLSFLNFSSVKIEYGDTIFATTDGVHHNLTQQEITTIAKNTNHQNLCRDLVTKAKKVADTYSVVDGKITGDFRAKPDDITAVAITIEENPQAITSDKNPTTDNPLKPGKVKPAEFKVLEPTDIRYPFPHTDTVFKLPDKNGWEIVGASRRGFSHENDAKYREDAMAVKRLNGWNLVAVADGGGAYDLSRVGANTAVQEAINAVKEMLQNNPSLPKTEDSIRNLLQKAVSTAYNAVLKKAKEHNSENPPNQHISEKDLRSTLLILIHAQTEDGKQVVGGFQIGDGIITIKDGSGNRSLLGKADTDPSGGNATQFLTTVNTNEWSKRIITKTINGKDSTIIVATDGISDDTNGIDDINILETPIEKIFLMNNPDDNLLNLIGYRHPGSFDDRTVVAIANKQTNS